MISLTVLAIPLFSQATSEAKPTFDVASVKASGSLENTEAKPKEEEAQAPPDGPPDPTRPSRGNLMVQSLLEDRFQLKTHREIRELPVYELTVTKGGLKTKASNGPLLTTCDRGRPDVSVAEQPLNGLTPRSVLTAGEGVGIDRHLVEANAKSLHSLAENRNRMEGNSNLS